MYQLDFFARHGACSDFGVAVLFFDVGVFAGKGCLVVVDGVLGLLCVVAAVCWVFFVLWQLSYGVSVMELFLSVASGSFLLKWYLFSEVI